MKCSLCYASLYIDTAVHIVPILVAESDTAIVRLCATWYTVDDMQTGHVNQVGHLSKTPLNLLEIHEIGSVDTFEFKQQNCDQI